MTLNVQYMSCLSENYFLFLLPYLGASMMYKYVTLSRVNWPYPNTLEEE